MDADLKAKWVAALRSGEYRQITGTLCDNHGYCCLGVLARVMGARVPNASRANYSSNTANKLYDRIDAVIGTSSMTLYRQNDNGTPFPEIADWIEANL